MGFWELVLGVTLGVIFGNLVIMLIRAIR